MNNSFLRLVQSIAFKVYYILNKLGVFKIVVFDNVFIYLYFMYKRKIESYDLEFLKSYLKKNVTVIDVGANIGFFTMEISKYLDSSSKIIAIEPGSINFLRMQKVIERKKPEPTISLILAGLSEKSGWGSLDIDPFNPANHTISEEHNSTELVELNTLDGITKNLNNVALIKVDVQGYELAVLKGGEKLLDEQSPVLLIEIDNRFNTNLGEKIWDYLDAKSYQMFRTDNLEEPVTKLQLKVSKGYFDVFCIKTRDVA
jgi:FkbM family methyltransferase